MKYGIDVAVTRIDDLDKYLTEYIRSCKKPVVLELGCGAGGLTTHLMGAGATVCAVDIEDYSEELQVNGIERSVHFITCDMRHLPTEYFETTYAAVIMQRVLHYIPHVDAIRLLRQLHNVSDRLYISVSGIGTEMALYYKDRQQPLARRFGPLDRTGQDMFSIRAPICLYSQDEFVKTLNAACWEVERVWTSAFGNHKAICA